MDALLVGAQVLLAGVFAVAGAAKLFDVSASRQAASDFGVPAPAAGAAGIAIPVAELVVAGTLLFHSTARWGALAALVLLVAFSAGIANAIRQGKDVDCGCFGPVYSATASTATLARNLALAAVAGFVVIEGPAPPLADWVGDRSAAELVAIGLGALAIALAVLALVYRSRTRSLRTSLADAPASGPYIEGLPPGSFAPTFTLPDQHSRPHTLESLLAGGRPVALLFFDQECGPCDEVGPHVARWQRITSEILTIAIVSAGTPEQASSTWAEHGLENVLYDGEKDVFEAFRIRSTPTALIIDRTGVIGSTPVGGFHGVEVLVRLALNRSRALHQLEGLRDLEDLSARIP